MSPILYSSEKLPLYFIAREASLPGCSQAYETVPGYHQDDLIFILSMSSGVTATFLPYPLIVFYSRH